MTTLNTLTSTAPVAPAQTPLDALSEQYNVVDEPYVPNPAAFAAATAKPAAPQATPAATPAAASVPQPAQPAPSPENQAAQGPPVTAAPSAQKHPTWLLNQATELGMHPLVIGRLDTAELGQLVSEQFSQILANRTQASIEQTVTNPNPPGQTPREVAAAATQTAPPAPQVTQFDWGEHQDFDEYGRPVAGKKRKYTDEDVNPAIAHHIKQLTEKVAAQDAFLKTMTAQVVQSREAQVEGQFDAAFSKYPAVFGVGSGREVRANPEFFQKRSMVFKAAKAMMQSLPPEVAAKLTIESAVQTMAASLLGVQPQAAAAATQPPPQTVNGAPKIDYQNGHVARPTARQEVARANGKSKATEAVAWWLQAQAAGDDGLPDGGPTVEDEFLN